MPSEIETKFRELADQWYDETKFSAYQDPNKPSYRAIVELGAPAIPVILQEVMDTMNGLGWSPALRELTGASPIPEAHAGRVRAIAVDWLRWGKENGYDIKPSDTEETP